MADAVRGIKAGVVAGIIYGPVSSIVGMLVMSSTMRSMTANNLPDSFYSIAMVVSIPSGMIYGGILGLIVGAIYGALYEKLPGSLSTVKALMISLVLWLIFSVGVGYITMSFSQSYYSRYFEMNMISGLLLYVFFGFLLGLFWDRFKGITKTCPSCNKTIPQDARICPYCAVSQNL
jgi:predicted Na+-dependent transporter